MLNLIIRVFIYVCSYAALFIVMFLACAYILNNKKVAKVLKSLL